MTAELPVSITAVIPAFNEAVSIARCVENCRSVADETLVVDAGSSDDTCQLAANAGARVIHALKGRGPQLNAGAAAARGQILLFVHADTQLPSAARGVLLRALERGYEAGNFKLRFEPETRAAGVYAFLNHVRRRTFGVYYGDSCIFVTRERFESLGGFQSLPLFEDHEFVRRLERVARTHYETEVVVTTSSRRFGERPLRTLALWTGLQALYAAGVPVPWLARFYADVR